MHGAEVGFQNITLDQFEVPALDGLAKFLAQVVNQHGVDFNGGYLLRVGQQRFREGSPAGADLNHERCVLAAGSSGNAVQDGGAGQEMLPETAAQDYPFTSIRLEWNQRRTLDTIGWPKLVAGMKLENTRAFSKRRRLSPFAKTPAPAMIA